MTTMNVPPGSRRPTWSRIVNALRRMLAARATRRQIKALGRKSFTASPRHIWGGDSIRIGDEVTIYRDARFEAFKPKSGDHSIVIGDGTVIHPGVHIGAVERVEIGRFVLMAAGCYITDHDHDWSDPFDPPISNDRVIVKPTRVCDYAWLGERVMVLKGVTIGERAVIGAGSLVTRDVPPFSVAVGAPARVVKTWDHEAGVWRNVDRQGE